MIGARTLPWCAGVAALLLAIGAAVAETDVPYLTGRVVDNAEVLKPATRERIAALSKAHEDKTTNQVVVLTIPTLGGESVEEFANRVFQSWKLGQKGKDNGVLVVVAPQDRKMRIEVGYGLEGTLPDVTASRIIRNVMTPAFRANDFDKGVGEGVAAIVATLEGDTGSAAKFADAPSGAKKPAFEVDTPDMPWYMRHPARLLHLRHHRPVHRHRRPDAGHGLVPVRLPDSVLGDVSDRHHRAESHRGAAGRICDRLSDRQAVALAQAVVRESGRGAQAEGHDQHRRNGHLVGWRVVVIVFVIVVRRRVLRRRRQFGRRRCVGQLVARGSCKMHGLHRFSGNMPMNSSCLIRVVIAAAFSAFAATAGAQFPDHPVTMIVPFPPGGVADTVGRPVADAMGRALGPAGGGREQGRRRRRHRHGAGREGEARRLHDPDGAGVVFGAAGSGQGAGARADVPVRRPETDRALHRRSDGSGGARRSTVEHVR
jgi:uncharacterized membrane protein YgcG